MDGGGPAAGTLVTVSDRRTTPKDRRGAVPDDVDDVDGVDGRSAATTCSECRCCCCCCACRLGEEADNDDGAGEYSACWLESGVRVKAPDDVCGLSKGGSGPFGLTGGRGSGREL